MLVYAQQSELNFMYQTQVDGLDVEVFHRSQLCGLSVPHGSSSNVTQGVGVTPLLMSHKALV